ncbi:hypothetical protein [Cupriavidus pampae]|uniref:GNAT family N-acetyltransferase n=1 Tax=Cupriavidus pampae TaxID=659251 RepID=A0ABM8XU29_9BURK|nr:hypothetical protein [Cupriavidus pampae]CAG9183863.1 hypothetical protein LMG32289_05446 [Cupriavidus pampae]
MPALAFQVGHLFEIDPRDPVIADMRVATERAIQQSQIRQDTTIGIWTDREHGSSLVGIAYVGEVFWRPGYGPDVRDAWYGAAAESATV